MYPHTKSYNSMDKTNQDMVCIDVSEFGKVPFRIGQAIAHFFVPLKLLAFDNAPGHDLEASCLLLLLLGIVTTLLLGSGGGLLPPDTTWTSTTEWRGKSKVDVLLGVETDDERWDVDDLLANTVKMLDLSSKIF